MGVETSPLQEIWTSVRGDYWSMYTHVIGFNHPHARISIKTLKTTFFNGGTLSGFREIHLP